ncbi:MAG: hypothetical protein QXJ33_05045 [Acidilobaceae archaeon]
MHSWGSMLLNLAGLIAIYVTVALIRASNAIFIVSLTLTLPQLEPKMHGLILASYSIAEALSGVIVGGFYEMIGSRALLSIAIIVLIASYITMSYYLNPIHLILLNSLAGVCAAIILVSTLTILGEETRGRFKGRLIGSGGFEASNIGGYALGFMIALILELFDLLRGFIIPALLVSLAFIVSIIIPNYRGYGSPIYVYDRRLLNLVPLWFSLASLIGVAFMSPKIISEVGITASFLNNTSLGGLISPLMIIGLIGGAVGLLVGSYIASIIGKYNALLLGSIFTPITLAIAGLYYEEILGRPIYIPLIAILAVPIMLLPPSLLAYLIDYTDKFKARGSSMGFYVTILGLGIGFGEYIIGGYIFQNLGLGGVGLSLALMFTILAIPTLYMIRLDEAKRISS